MNNKVLFQLQPIVMQPTQVCEPKVIYIQLVPIVHNNVIEVEVEVYYYELLIVLVGWKFEENLINWMVISME